MGSIDENGVWHGEDESSFLSEDAFNNLKKEVSNFLNSIPDSTDGHDYCWKALIAAALSKAKYNQAKAAKVLGISRASFRSRLYRYYGEEFITLKNSNSGK